MKLKYTFEMIEMDGDMVAVPVGNAADEFSGLVRLNQSASDIFELLTNDLTEEELVTALAERYDTDRETIAASVHSYLKTLQSDGLLDL